MLIYLILMFVHKKNVVLQQSNADSVGGMSSVSSQSPVSPYILCVGAGVWLDTDDMLQL